MLAGMREVFAIVVCAVVATIVLIDIFRPDLTKVKSGESGGDAGAVGGGHGGSDCGGGDGGACH